MTVSAQLHAPGDAAELVAALGGQEEIAKMAPQSKQLSILVARDADSRGQKKGQDCIYRGMGLTNILAHAELIKPRFDALCETFVGLASERGYDVQYQAVSVKSYDSAQAKVNVDYHGDPSMCNDLVRGTLYIKGIPGKDTLTSAYGVLDLIINAKSELHAASACFTSFKDRYQKPAGSYRDWMLLIKIADFTCELQVNLEAALEIKLKKQHAAYELARMANRSLLDAAMRGVLKMVRIILSSKCGQTDCTDARDFTPLHYAARHGSIEMIEALLAADADVLRPDGLGRLPIYHAALMQHVPAMELLISAMEDRKQIDFALLADAPKSSLQRAGTFATSSGNNNRPELSERLSALITHALSHTDDQMHAAAHSGDAHTCKLLLDKGAMTGSMRFQPDIGYACTGLDQAIASGSVDTVKVMLNAGVKPLLSTMYGEKGPHEDFIRAAIDYARRDMAPQLAALIASRNEANLPDMGEVVQAAIKANAHDALLRLQEIGAKVNEVDDSATTALHEAAGINNVRAVKALLQMGVPPNSKDINDRTALHIAAAGGFIELSRVLIQAKADVDAVGVDGWTPALRAGQRGQSIAIQLLYEAEADLTKKASNFICPAWIAACNGHIHVIEYLWEKTDGDTKELVKNPDVLCIAEERSPSIAAYIQGNALGGT